jgi:alkylation response protein AidB-like acyl-CoA dehydrogenase
METTAVRDGDEWVINGEKTWNTGIHKAQYDMIMARTSGKAGDGDGITAFLVPTKNEGFEVLEYLWTFNMPTDHAHIRLTDVRVPASAVFGVEGRGLRTRVRYWEGAVDARGTSNGVGYLEMTGYAK